MSKKVYSDNYDRQLVEVPMPANTKTRQSRSQLSFDGDDYVQYDDPRRMGGRNDKITNAIVPFNNNNRPPQQFNDEYAMVPRVGSKKKTIIIKDEKGNEISRIVSSNQKDRMPMMDNRNSFNGAPVQQQQQFIPQQQPSQFPQQQQQYPPQQQQYPPQQTQYPPQSALTPLVLQPQQFLMQPAVGTQIPPMTPVPVIVQPQYSANPYNSNNIDSSRSIINQTIPEETMTSAKNNKRASAHYRTLEKAREVRTAKERDREFKDLRRNDDLSLMGDMDTLSPSAIRPVDRREYIFCCAFCEKANTDTCEFCWRLCGFPTWFAVLIGLIFAVIIVALVVVLILYAVNVI